jgi:hypothetical protein
MLLKDKAQKLKPDSSHAKVGAQYKKQAVQSNPIDIIQLRVSDDSGSFTDDPLPVSKTQHYKDQE